MTFDLRRHEKKARQAKTVAVNRDARLAVLATEKRGDGPAALSLP
jgi:hypothetical protein